MHHSTKVAAQTSNYLYVALKGSGSSPSRTRLQSNWSMVFAEHTLLLCVTAKAESSTQGKENPEHWISKNSLSGEISMTIPDKSESEPSGHVMETATHRICHIDQDYFNSTSCDIHQQSAIGHAVVGVGTGTVQTIILPLKIFTSNTSFSAKE
ncbi:hypothetical protein HJC23_004430 [Cyclotella cryptica]|uniref:Uncharacterized protein n=1 Tax=Cyclotella cryptica TaxID=29204 RepID=A0ABD3QF44_9STRA|eukprot:CCRYP_006037-RA/>CCRYP_006037-RA protein AED:0.44 eAED:0.44 QI:0/-1/0/1/-1/1/1/0/152